LHFWYKILPNTEENLGKIFKIVTIRCRLLRQKFRLGLRWESQIIIQMITKERRRMLYYKKAVCRIHRPFKNSVQMAGRVEGGMRYLASGRRRRSYATGDASVSANTALLQH